MYSVTKDILKTSLTKIDTNDIKFEFVHFYLDVTVVIVRFAKSICFICTVVCGA